MLESVNRLKCKKPGKNLINTEFERIAVVEGENSKIERIALVAREIWENCRRVFMKMQEIRERRSYRERKLNEKMWNWEKTREKLIQK